MPRNRFRSQPTLQRSGSRPSIWPWALGVVAIAAGGVVGVELGRFTPAPPAVAPKVAAAPVPAESMAMNDAPAVVSDSPAPQAPQAPQAALSASRPEPQTLRAPPRRKTPPAVEAATPVAAAQTPPTYEQRREAFQLALARYDQSERAAGYKWAKENRVARSRYCRDESRTSAFMAGCLDYLHKAPPSMGDAAQDAAGHERDGDSSPQKE
jgi:hypothetical protein